MRPFPLRTGFAEVVKVAAVTPLMRRVTLTAPQFADFGVEEPGEIITLGWPDPGAELVLPELGWRFPPGKREQLLVADETGLPALLAILESLPAGHRAVALAEVTGEAEHQEVRTPAQADLRRLRPGEAARAVRELELPRGHGHVWSGGRAAKR